MAAISWVSTEKLEYLTLKLKMLYIVDLQLLVCVYLVSENNFHISEPSSFCQITLSL